MTVTKGKDNIPGWDGNPATWTEYRKSAQLYEETVKWENRYLCGPRLAAELSGAAKAAISSKKKGWLSHSNGVDKLLRCLRSSMSEPALPEIANQLRAYFKVLRRRRGESMAAFCVRHREEYAKTCKALTRVMKERKMLKKKDHKTNWHSERRLSRSSALTLTDSRSERSGRQGGTSDLASEGISGDQDPAEADEPPEGDAEEGERWDDYDDWWYWTTGWMDPAWYQDAWYPGGVQYQPDEDDEDLSEDPEEDDEDFVEILPDVIKGWLLLEKANIDHLERSLIQSEVKNDFSLQAVESALRSHFTDDMIRRKDGDSRHALYGDEEMDQEDEINFGDEDEAFFETLSEEDMAFYQQAKADAEAAWMQIQQGRQTLREARAKQHEVRMGRRFFSSSHFGKGKGKSNDRDRFRGKGSNFTKGGGPCARCGKNHDTKDCPQKSQSSGGEQKTFEAEEVEHSEFIYGQTWCSGDPVCFSGTHMSTQDAMMAGYGVLDGGATKTMASIKALECLEEKCKEKDHQGISKVDLSEQPTFGFGNSHRGRCVSTCYFKVPTKEKSMSLKIHALDQGNAPVLISVDTLRRLGAIVDFRNDQAIFSDVNPKKLIALQRSVAGHQLIPLAEDFMSKGKPLAQAVHSLAQLVE